MEFLLGSNMTSGLVLFSTLPVTQGHLHPPSHPDPYTEHSSKTTEAPAPSKEAPARTGVGVSLNVLMLQMD